MALPTSAGWRQSYFVLVGCDLLAFAGLLLHCCCRSPVRIDKPASAFARTLQLIKLWRRHSIGPCHSQFPKCPSIKLHSLIERRCPILYIIRRKCLFLPPIRSVQPRILFGSTTHGTDCTLEIQRICGEMPSSKDALSFLIDHNKSQHCSKYNYHHPQQQQPYCQLPPPFPSSLVCPFVAPLTSSWIYCAFAAFGIPTPKPITIPVPFSVLTQPSSTTRSKNHLLSSAAAIDQASQIQLTQKSTTNSRSRAPHLQPNCLPFPSASSHQPPD